MSQSVAPIPEENRPSVFDAILRRRVIEPVAQFIPDGVHPNTISLITPVFALTSFGLAAAAPQQADALVALLLRVAAGVFMFGSMLTDHVDGLHARRTGQTSKLGEALDHWFDSLHVPLAAAGFAATVSAEGWLLGSVVITAGGVYNAQLVLYYHTKQFVYPPTGGAWAQTMLAVAYAAAGAFFYWVPGDASFVGESFSLDLALGIEIFLWLVVVGNVRNILFYFRRLRRRSVDALIFLAVSFAFIPGLMVVDTSGPFLAVLLCLVSLYVNGAWILNTLTDRKYWGADWLLLAWMAVVLANGFTGGQGTILGPWPVAAVLPWALAAVLAGTSIAAFMNKTKAMRGG